MRRPAPSGLVAAGLALAATACGGPTTVPAAEGPSASTVADPSTDAPTATSPDAGRTLTVADDGAEVVLLVGEQVELVQSDPLSADPTVDGEAVELVEVVSVAGSGQREWEVRGLVPGVAHLTVPDGATTFGVTIEVR